MQIRSIRMEEKPLLMIIPMIDIIFFLLVFFMMSMLTMVTQRTVALNLPHASIAKVDTTKTVPVSITHDGRIFLEQDAVSLDVLASRLSLLTLESDKITVVLRGDMDAYYGKVVAVLDTIRQTGIERVSIATEGKMQ
ncbi:ExbD/TolR family protein [Budvicia aquatica]|uniref:Biopolymer transport protein exbD n=1 Tax=Budvicia aquatica TaxID=82979 RepID=A0A2C6DP10_9GAMM|nr:biopolymer transporter ExbD [Budvicia aquatica]PHI30072.1 biopolymer transporter ExbD [Budvicia aquatica]VFS49064.1 Biopolymer transport protein exbD [Budvicia aquatica]